MMKRIFEEVNGKKAYETPCMRVIELQHKTQMLQSSGGDVKQVLFYSGELG